jgi:diguanylate cyclase (GGDEF)-like protein
MSDGADIRLEECFREERLQALDRYDILDTPREESFDRIAQLIRTIFDVPIGIVSMIDAHRQWYKAASGMPVREVGLKSTFCRFALEGSAPLIIPDATKDVRVAGNPSVQHEPHIRFYAGVPLRTRDGFNIGTICAIGLEPRQFTAQQTDILANLAKIVMDELELRQLATQDSLTGLLSRRAFKDEANRLFGLAKRHNQALSCIVFDIDRFKSINDSFGHGFGDRVLQEAAKCCQSGLRQTDLIGRLGGEEFGALLPHTGKEAALEVAERIRASLAQVRFDDVPLGKVTASFGVAALEKSIGDLDSLIKQADGAMYEAKSTGRDRCVVWKGIEQTKAPRRRVLKAGRIIFNARTSAIDCTVRTLAEDGAGVDVTSAVGIPPKFFLQIRSDNFESLCRVVGQSEKHLDLEFC